jgi:hypothetical protein
MDEFVQNYIHIPIFKRILSTANFKEQNTEGIHIAGSSKMPGSKRFLRHEGERTAVDTIGSAVKLIIAWKTGCLLLSLTSTDIMSSNQDVK